jgi:DNA-binding NarL/FixJ family response regulator
MIVGDIEGRLACARAVHAEALACSDPDGLERAAETFDEIGADLLAAEATADAAEAWRRAGDPRRATAAQRRATALAERCERPTTPVLRMIGARARLTPGEREAALLAAGGRSNKAIAEDLCLSTRTVENRLQRVYEKLGIAGRAQLGDALSTVD